MRSLRLLRFESRWGRTVLLNRIITSSFGSIRRCRFALHRLYRWWWWWRRWRRSTVPRRLIRPHVNNPTARLTVVPPRRPSLDLPVPRGSRRRRRGSFRAGSFVLSFRSPSCSSRSRICCSCCSRRRLHSCLGWAYGRRTVTDYRRTLPVRLRQWGRHPVFVRCGVAVCLASAALGRRRRHRRRRWWRRRRR